MRGWRIGTIGGIVVEINYTWLIIFGLFFVSLSTGWFPEAHPNMPKVYHWLAGLIATALLFASVLLHELAHSLVGRRSGIEVSRITLFVFGGVAQMKSEPTEPLDEFKMAIAGPATSFILAGLFGALWLALRGLPGLVLTAETVRYLAYANGVLALFNLVPAFPLDGGRVLRSVIWYFTHDLEHSTRIATTMGQIFGFLLMGLGFWEFMAGGGITGIWYLALGWLLASAAQSSYQHVRMQHVLGDVPVSALMSSPAVTIPANITISQAIQDYFMRLRHGAFPVLDYMGRLVGMLSLSQVKERDQQQWPMLQVSQVMEPLNSDEMTIRPYDEAVNAMLKMAQSSRGRLLVTDATGELVGIISHSDILGLIRIKAGLGV